MKQSDFETRYSAQWTAFEATLKRVEARRTLSRDEIGEFGQRYRRICQLMSIAKSRHYSAFLVDKLNRLVIQGHQVLYHRRDRYWLVFTGFVFNEFPRLVRQEARFVWISAALLFLPTFILGWLTYNNDLLVYSVFKPEQVEAFAAMYQPVNGKIGEGRGADTDVAMFGYYIMNNIGVGFRTFASGLVFGLGTLFFLVYNGVVFGAVAGYLTHLGFVDTFYPFVVGHSSFELSAIVLAGAAGLKMGWALLAPGVYSRLTSLRLVGRDTVRLIYGIIGMLVIAAFIEAFWSSSALIENSVKYAVALVLWCCVVGYFYWVGR